MTFLFVNDKYIIIVNDCVCVCVFGVQGQRCDMCSTPLHFSCANKLFANKPTPRCPQNNCSAPWPVLRQSQSTGEFISHSYSVCHFVLVILSLQYFDKKLNICFNYSFVFISFVFIVTHLQSYCYCGDLKLFYSVNLISYPSQLILCTAFFQFYCITCRCSALL